MKTTAQHTPGPWRVETWHYSASLPGMVRDVPTIQTDKDAIAQCCELWRNGNDSSAERAANARLLVEAPAMRDLLTDIACYCPVTVQDSIRALVTRIDGGQQ